MTNEAFILANRKENVRELALRKAPEGIDLKFCLQQIEGWQLAQTKLPIWATHDKILFPPKLSMEQCSSQLTASYKSSIVERILSSEQRNTFADLTGGFGIDFSFIAKHFRRAIYIERQEELCQVAQHNFNVLELNQADVWNGDCLDYLEAIGHADLIFVDPARRDSNGRKTVALRDCVPDMTQLYPRLQAQAKIVVVKLSPMLDIRETIRLLPNIQEIHVVSVQGECKELLIVLGKGNDTCVTYYCVNLGTEETPLIWKEDTLSQKPTLVLSPPSNDKFLFEPNASILKAGLQDELCSLFGIEKLHPCSHLFIGTERIENFPGRTFQIDGSSSFRKQDLKILIGDLRKANITIRNFPIPVTKLRQKLRLKEGGDTYLFATTYKDNTHLLIRCHKA